MEAEGVDPRLGHPTDPTLLHSGGYRKLRSYKVAEAVYDATVVFCRRFLAHDRRLTDQMVQAARSGVRNISEASGAAATSRKTEMKLTNVARASLSDELVRDYKTSLVQNGLRVWPKDSKDARAMRSRLMQDSGHSLPAARAAKIRLAGLSGLSDFVGKAEPEIAANAMLCAVNQPAYLLRRQLESQSREFLEKGGFTENLYAARVQARSRSMVPVQPPLLCPRCGQPMVKRCAKKGPRSGEKFWGCSAYPDCKGTRPIEQQSDKSDASDASDASDLSDKTPPL
jgi:restriction system protein